MPVTQMWIFAAVPPVHESEVSEAFSNSLTEARSYFTQNARAFENWRRNPSSFICNREAYDIHGRFKVLLPEDPWSWQTYQSFFVRPEFYSLFQKFDRNTESGFAFSEKNILDVVITRGDTAAIILHQALGPENSIKLPGFFGSLFLTHIELVDEYKRVQEVFESENSRKMLAQALAWTRGYNDEEVVKQILRVFPDAMRKSISKSCGILALQLTVG